MRLAALAMITIFMCATPAGAASALDKFIRELDRAGQDLFRELGKIGNRRADQSPQISGICMTYSARGNKRDEKTCIQQFVCPSDDRCIHTFTWPSGSRTVVDDPSDRHPTINGQASRPVSVSGDYFCFNNLVTTNTFCFVRQNQSSLPDYVADFDKSPATVEFGYGQSAGVSANQPVEAQKKLRQSQQALEDNKRRRKIAEREKEHRTKLKLISSLADKLEIKRYFRDKTIGTLKPIDAAGDCQDQFFKRASNISNPIPIEAAAEIRSRCKWGAEIYGKQIIEEVTKTAISKVVSLPPTFESLRGHNWYVLDRDTSEKFTEDQQDELRLIYSDGIKAHRVKSISNATTEIEKAFQHATPYTESAKAALELCGFDDAPPIEIFNFCKDQVSKFRVREKEARCSKALADSGASAKNQNMLIQYGGPAYKMWTLARVICIGRENRPGHKVEIGNGYLSWIDDPYLRIRNGRGETVLNVKLRVASERDGRSFTKLLWDITTGENEREVLEYFVVDEVWYAAPDLPSRNSRAVIGCTLGIIECR